MPRSHHQLKLTTPLNMHLCQERIQHLQGQKLKAGLAHPLIASPLAIKAVATEPEDENSVTFSLTAQEAGDTVHFKGILKRSHQTHMILNASVDQMTQAKYMVPGGILLMIAILPLDFAIFTIGMLFLLTLWSHYRSRMVAIINPVFDLFERILESHP